MGKSGAAPRPSAPGRITPKPAAPSRPQSLGLRRQLALIENAIADRSTEQAHILDQQGNVVFMKHGTSKSVDFTPEERSRMRGTILTHNHPSNTSFSQHDIGFAHQEGLREVRAVSISYTHSMRPAHGTEFTQAHYDQVVAPIVLMTDARVRRDFLSAIRRGEMTYDEAEARHNHELWTRVAAATGMRYTRTIRRSGRRYVR